MFRPSSVLALGAFLFVALGSSRARAAHSLTVSEPTLDLPTLVTLGLRMNITGDDNFNAAVTVRYKKSADTAWQTGMPLFRVHPEQLQSAAPPPQFAGSLFDLAPNTSYDVELHAVDPDGGDFTKTVTGKTAAVPSDPTAPKVVNVTNQATLQTALTAAKPGAVLVLAAGTYGPYVSIPASGTAQNPIVIRGASQSGVILDGGGCTGCNVVELSGTGNVHLENLTIQNGERAIRVQATNTSGNVFRRLHIKNVVLGLTTNANANGYYVADNVLEGRLVWPAVYKDDSGAHANDDGINLRGSGNVIAYNRLSGFGDAMKTEQDQNRANDFYGNDVLWTYDNGVELDGCQGNCRAFRNRWTNTYATTSFQPIFGGPAYLLRNVIVNVADEPFKLHALGGVTSPSGVVILHNTVVKSGSSLQLSTAAVPKSVVFRNNLFVANPSDGYSVRWDVPALDPSVSLDFDGYYPDGKFELGYSNVGPSKTYANFAAAVQSGVFEGKGLLVAASNFASGLVTPTAYTALLAAQDVTLAPSSLAVDKGTAIANVNDGYRGIAPDLGALELGCVLPTFGPRPDGVDESTTSYGCGSATSPDGGVTQDGGGTDGGNADGGTEPPVDDGSGCGCNAPGRNADTASIIAALALAVAAVVGRRARRQS
ncbi:hypothetical protein BH09MYX1_BH09MYX1_45600 [soil metagenome]